MKRSFLLIVLLFFLNACSPEVTPYTYPTQRPFPTATVRRTSPTQFLAPTRDNSITGCANGNPYVRGGPGTQYASKGLLLNGTCGTITGRTDDANWVYVQTRSISGWVFGEFVRVSGEIYNAPLLKNYSLILPNEVIPNSPNNPAPAGGCPNGCTTQIAGCNIKGNISYNGGEKIYHAPGQTYYNDTVINPNYGERWFCTEAEAVSNGWRRAEN
jgi:hypothetical protein